MTTLNGHPLGHRCTVCGLPMASSSTANVHSVCQPEQPDTYYEAVRELQDRLAWHQDILDNHRHRIEEYAEQATALEDKCVPIEATITSIRALIALAGGTP